MFFHESKLFIKYLDNFIKRPDATNTNFLKTNKSRIPPMFRGYSRELYRGMSLDEQEFELLKNGRFKIEKTSSWTKDESTAKKFIQDSKFNFQKLKNHKVILKKRITQSDIIVDIDAYVNFYGEDKLIEMGFDDLRVDSAMKEKEVLVGPISIKKNEFREIL